LNQPPTPGDAAYQINVETLGRLAAPEQFADIIVKSDNRGRVTRIREIGSATRTLVAQDPGRTKLTSGYAKAVDGLNLFDTQYFAADLESEAVQRRLADALADQITLQLATFFRKRATVKG